MYSISVYEIYLLYCEGSVDRATSDHAEPPGMVNNPSCRNRRWKEGKPSHVDATSATGSFYP